METHSMLKAEMWDMNNRRKNEKWRVLHCLILDPAQLILGGHFKRRTLHSSLSLVQFS